MDGEYTSIPEGALHRYMATVCLSDVFDDSKAQSGAA